MNGPNTPAWAQALWDDGILWVETRTLAPGTDGFDLALEDDIRAVIAVPRLTWLEPVEERRVVRRVDPALLAPQVVTADDPPLKAPQRLRLEVLEPVRRRPIAVALLFPAVAADPFPLELLRSRGLPAWAREALESRVLGQMVIVAEAPAAPSPYPDELLGVRRVPGFRRDPVVVGPLRVALLPVEEGPAELHEALLALRRRLAAATVVAERPVARRIHIGPFVPPPPVDDPPLRARFPRPAEPEPRRILRLAPWLPPLHVEPPVEAFPTELFVPRRPGRAIVPSLPGPTRRFDPALLGPVVVADAPPFTRGRPGWTRIAEVLERRRRPFGLPLDLLHRPPTALALRVRALSNVRYGVTDLGAPVYAVDALSEPALDTEATP